jgi:hypothetical protein
VDRTIPSGFTNSGKHVYYRLQNLDVDSVPSESTALSNLDAKTSTLCTNVKNSGIRLYTITFGSMSASATTLMENCASENEDGDPLYFHAPNSQQLGEIFHEIGQDLSEIHLAM